VIYEVPAVWLVASNMEELSPVPVKGGYLISFFETQLAGQILFLEECCGDRIEQKLKLFTHSHKPLIILNGHLWSK